MTALLITLVCMAVFSFGMFVRACIKVDQAHKAYVEARHENRYSWHWSNN